MKRKRKTSKKQPKWHEKLWNHAVSAKNWTVRLVTDHDFLPAASLLLLGGALLAGCLTVEIAAGLAAVIVGGKHLYEIIRYN
tara:strand:- start:1150 stop:1395 length:246 start_codon:yes stop_codon:yes gene_type:complete